MLRTVAREREPLPADPWRFLTDCVFTNDEYARAKGIEPVQPFPRHPYLKYLTDQWQATDRLRLEKSRDVLATWWAAAVHLHAALTIPGCYVGYQSKKLLDGNLFIESRFMFMLRRIPWTRFSVPVVTHNKSDGILTVEHPDGMRSYIVVVPQGTEQARQWKFLYYLWDEMGAAEQQEKCWTAIRPALAVGGRFTGICSAKGKSNLFYQLGYEDIGSERVASKPRPPAPLAVVHDEPGVDRKTSAEVRDSVWWHREFGKKFGATMPAYGVNRWEKNGFLNLRVHFGADAMKHPATDTGRAYIEATMRDMPAYSWLQEYGVAFDVTPGRPVYCDTQKIEAVPQLYRPWLKLFRATDFGWTMPACVYAQVEEKSKEEWRVRFIREVIGRDILLTDFLDKHVIPDAALYFPDANVEDVADPAGKQHDDKSPETSMEIMNSRGIWPRSRVASVDEGVTLLQTLVTLGWVEIDPVACKTLYEAVRSGHVRDEDGFPLKDGYYEHVCLVAGTMVTTRSGPVAIEDVRPGDLALTRAGWRPVVRAWQTAASARVYRVRTEGGRELVGTAEHPVWVVGRGWIRLDALRYGDRLLGCQKASTSDANLERSWTSTALSIDGIPRTSLGRNGTTLDRPAGMSRRACCIARSGRLPTERSQPVTTSITATAILSTIGWRIWSVLRGRSTSGIICGCEWPTRRTGNATPLSWPRFGTWLRRGTGQWRGGPGIARTDGGLGWAAVGTRRSGVSIAQNSSGVSPRAENSARTTVARQPGGPRIATTFCGDAPAVASDSLSTGTRPSDFAHDAVLHVTPVVDPAPVFNLTVEGAHEFFANGLLVSNCDAARYLVAYIFRLRPLIIGGKRVNKVELAQISTALVSGPARRPAADGRTGLVRPS